MFEQQVVTAKEKIDSEATLREYPSSFSSATPRVQEAFQEYWENLKASENDDIVKRGDVEVTKEEKRKFFDEQFNKLELLLNPELPDNVCEIETDYANIRLIYEWHGQQMPVSTVVGLDMICAEGIMAGGLLEIYKDAQRRPRDNENDYVELDREEYGCLGNVGNEENDSLVVAALEDLQIPVMINDIHGSALIKHARLEIEEFAEFEKKLSSVAGATIPIMMISLADRLLNRVLSKAYNADQYQEKKEKMSRRKFLRLLTDGALVTAATVSGVASYAADTPNEKESMHSKMNKLYRLTSESLGFEQFVTYFRNALMAQKIYDVAHKFNEDENNNGKKPHIGMQLGAAHTTIEQMLQMSEEDRLNIITKGIELLLAQGIEFDVSLQVESVFDDESEKWRSHISDNRKIQNIVEVTKDKLSVNTSIVDSIE